MINLQFLREDGTEAGIEYDVHPRSQETSIPIPDGTVSVIVWIGVRA